MEEGALGRKGEVVQGAREGEGGKCRQAPHPGGVRALWCVACRGLMVAGSLAVQVRAPGYYGYLSRLLRDVSHSVSLLPASPSCTLLPTETCSLSACLPCTPGGQPRQGPSCGDGGRGRSPAGRVPHGQGWVTLVHNAGPQQPGGAASFHAHARTRAVVTRSEVEDRPGLAGCVRAGGGWVHGV